MAHQVPWNKTIIDVFSEEALLSDDEIFLVTTRAKGWTVTRQALYLNKSESSIHQMIATLKKKYDVAQKNRPDELPPRRFSMEEVYMDNH